MNSIVAEATHALVSYVFVLGNLLIGYLAYKFAARDASLSGFRTVQHKLKIYALVLLATVFLSYGAATTYGTYCATQDEFGCDEVVTIFSPTDKEREAHGWGMFFMLIGPALVGATIGLWSPGK